MHPASCTDPDCTLTYRDHLLGIAISADATPNRRAVSHNTNVRERALSRDMDAYRTMRRNGIQPPHIDGSLELSQRANTVEEIPTLGSRITRRMKVTGK